MFCFSITVGWSFCSCLFLYSFLKLGFSLLNPEIEYPQMAKQEFVFNSRPEDIFPFIRRCNNPSLSIPGERRLEA